MAILESWHGYILINIVLPEISHCSVNSEWALDRVGEDRIKPTFYTHKY